MLTTRFTELVGCSVPIQQAGMADLSSPRLAATVAEAGGLGMVSVYGATPAEVAALLDATRAQTSRVFGANFIMRFVDPALAHECIAVAAAKARVVEFFYSDPDPTLIELVHAHGALACWQVGSREEALAAAEAGCDFLIAQGIEAGGHVRGRSGVLALLDQVLATVDLPVLVAGGIGSGRAMAAALAAGADGVRVGTRFVAAEEAGAHPAYVQALIAAEAQDTVYTDVFSVGWPDAPHRCLRSSVESAQRFQGDIVGEGLDHATGKPFSIHRFACLAITETTRGAIAVMPQWAGESVGGVKRAQPAAEIVHELARDAEQLLRRWS